MELNSNPPSSGSGATNNSTNGNLSNAQRPGEHLRQLRTMQKRSLSDVARELNMSERQLNALESDDYKMLPEPAFIKGYLRTYAKLLGADATHLIHRFNEIYTSDTGLPTNHALENSPLKALGLLQRGRRRRFNWVGWLIAALVIILLLWLLIAGVQSWRNSPSQPSQEAARNVLPANKKVANETDLSSTNNNTLPTVLNVPAPVVNTSTDDRLSLSFSRPVSVSIHDATGKKLASGSQSEALTLTGPSPFSIRLDDAEAVSLSFNQEKVSLSPYTVDGKAEFRLSR